MRCPLESADTITAISARVISDTAHWMNKLEEHNSTKRGDAPQWPYAPDHCTAYKSGTDYHVGSRLYRPQHFLYLSWIMRVVAVHDDQYVFVMCRLDNIPD